MTQESELIPQESDKNPSDRGSEISSVPTVHSVEEILAGSGRDIDEIGGFDLEINEQRTADEIRHNRPGPKLREKILGLPDLPGVYMYVDKSGKVIYVGKAKRLKRRVSSYWNRMHDSTRTNLLVRNKPIPGS